MPDYFAIVVINFVCIFLQLIMTVVLVYSTKMRHGMAYASIIISVCTIPVYCANMLRDMGVYDAFVIVSYVCCFVNAILMPMIWFFTRSQLISDFKFKPIFLLHLLPAAVSLAVNLAYYHSMSHEELVDDIIRELSGKENIAHVINDVIVFVQMFVYFTLSIRLIRKTKRVVMEEFSNSGFFSAQWVSTFIYLMATLFFIVFVAYIINPRTDSWIIPILNILITCYLVYYSIVNPIIPIVKNHDENGLAKSMANNNVEEAKLKEFSGQIMTFLKESKEFTNPDLLLHDVAKATGISDRNASLAINKCLSCSFFELINRMRIEEAKRQMLLPESSRITIEAIALSCGFRSRSSFYTAFSKFEKTSPSRWLKKR